MELYDIWIKGENKERNFTSDELASQFRMLKENFHNIGYYDDEDKGVLCLHALQTFGIEGRSTERLQGQKQESFRRSFYCLFEKIGGFGTKPLSVLSWAAGFIVGFGLLQAVFMDAASVWMKLLKGCYFSTITFFYHRLRRRAACQRLVGCAVGCGRVCGGGADVLLHCRSGAKTAEIMVRCNRISVGNGCISNKF
jgi:hypothetical protein